MFMLRIWAQIIYVFNECAADTSLKVLINIIIIIIIIITRKSTSFSNSLPDITSFLTFSFKDKYFINDAMQELNWVNATCTKM